MHEQKCSVFSFSFTVDIFSEQRKCCLQRPVFVAGCNPCIERPVNIERSLMFSLREMRIKEDLSSYIATLGISVDPVCYLAIYHMLTAEVFSSFSNHIMDFLVVIL